METTLHLHLKNFPEELKKKLKAKAALEGITLRALVVRILNDGLK